MAEATLLSGVSFEELDQYHPLAVLQRMPDSPERKQYIEQLRSYGYLKPDNDGGFVRFGRRTLQGYNNMMRGVGATGEVLGLGSEMREFYDARLATNQQWNNPENPTVFEYVMGGAGGALGNMAVLAPVMLADGLVGTKGALTFSTCFATTYGENVQRNLAAGYSPEKAYGLGAVESSLDAIIEVALGTVPTVGRSFKAMGYAGKRALVRQMFREAEKDLGRSGAKRFFLALAKNGAEEGAEEAMQYINSWFWRMVGGDASNTFDLKELADNTAQGFIGGVALGGLDAYKSARYGSSPASTQYFGKVRPWMPQEKAARIETQNRIREEMKLYQKTGSGLVEAIGDEMGLKVRFFDEEGAPPATTAKGEAIASFYAPSLPYSLTRM